MDFYNFEKFPYSNKAYGGKSCNKIGISSYDGNYMVKFPRRLKELNLKNVEISYSNSPVSEYLGSRFYELFNIPVQKSILGYYNDVVVVACKDFRDSGEELIEFRQLRVTMPPSWIDGSDQPDPSTSGFGSDLDSVLYVINNQPLLKTLPGVKERFWDMFIIDALIGNPDRNNENWGILTKSNDIKLAPVYDNGNSFFPRLSEDQMEDILNSKSKTEERSYTGRYCFFTKNGRKINPYQYIEKAENPDCNASLTRLFSNTDFKKMFDIIDNVPLLSETQKDFHKQILHARMENIFIPTYEKLVQEVPDFNYKCL